MRGVTKWWLAGLVLASSGLSARGEEPYRVIYPKQDRAAAAALAGPVREPAYSAGLRDVLAEVADGHDVNIVIDEAALSDARADLDGHVDLDVEGMAARHGDKPDLAWLLRTLLEPYDATYYVEDGLIKITTKEVAAGRSLLRAYDVAGLLDEQTTGEDLAQGVTRLGASLKAGRPQPPVREVSAASPLTAEPPMHVVPYKTMLIVAANPDDHRRVEKALGMIGQIVAE